MPKRDYYKEKLKQINLLIDQKKYKEALKLVTEEIEVPYIPKDYIDQFESLYIMLSERANIEAIEKKYNTMTKTELLLEAYNGKTLNINVLSFFLAKFANEVDKLDYVVLEQIFLDKNISNDLKVFSLEQIRLSELNHDFVFFNNMTNKEININSMSDFEFDKDPYYIFINKYIEDQLFKDPSLKPLAQHTLKLCYEYYFGSRPPYEKVELGVNIVEYIRSYFNNSSNANPEFVNWVNNLFTFKKLKN